MQFHKILQRQLIKEFGSEDKIPAHLTSLFQAISTTYAHADVDRNLIERSLEISSRELQQQNELIEREVARRTQELAAERNKLSVTLGSITDAVITLDLEKRILFYNKAAEKMFGISAADVVGRYIGDIMKVYDHKAELTPEQYAQFRENYEGTVFSKENIKLVTDKKEVMVNFISGVILEGLDVNVGCILMMHDVSEQAQLESMKIDFVSMAAHELRTPLTSFRSYLSVFQEESQEKINDEEKMFLNRMSIAADRLMMLVENLLDVSKIERGAFVVQMQPIDWLPVVKDAVAELTNRAKERNITITLVEPTEKLHKINVDIERMREVITNLLANAVNYTATGGSITVTVEEKDGQVITHVKDTGHGIPPEAIPHLFTKFFRVWGKLEMGSKGTGLGLYISKSIVDMHHGKIWAESEVGKGSTFSFSLPWYNEAQE